MAASNKKPIAESRGATIPVLPLRDGALFPGVIHTLHIARESTKRAIRAANEADGMVLCVGQLDPRTEEPRFGELQRVGVVCELLQASPLPDGSLRAILRALHRANWSATAKKPGVSMARVESFEVEFEESDELTAKARECVRRFLPLVEKHDSIPSECASALTHAVSSASISDLIAYHLPCSLAKKQLLVEEANPSIRLDFLLAEISRETKLLDIQRKVAEQVDSAFGDTQREFYLREQLKAIRVELGEDDSRAEAQDWEQRIHSASMPANALERANSVLSRIELHPASTPEGSALREYLDWVVSMPWANRSGIGFDLESAKQILDQRHFGIEKVKERIIEFLAVQQLSRELRGPILCFVGPPGVGKSSAAASIAQAMGRKCVRIALGGLRDEAELRGHRRTYVGAMPGRIIKEVRMCGSNDPVILLDEIDKLSRDWRGDPAGALLEALDPSMNDGFVDHYLDLPFSLRNAVFVATANSMDHVLPALTDRLEVVDFSSYTSIERREIAMRHLLPNQIDQHGLASDQVQMMPEAIDALVDEYSWEPGVRQLDQRIATVCRKVARQVAEGKSDTQVVGLEELEKWLGPSDLDSSNIGLDRDGRMMGLAVSAYGGMAMPIEAAVLESVGPQPTILVTGNAGDVMRESAQAAATYVRKNLVKLGIEGNLAKDIHVHVGEGALPKDGPSAGLPMTLALISAAAKRALSCSVAASGEVGLHGDIRPVGGVREKLIAAKREKLKRVLLPERNRKEVESMSTDVVEGTEIVFVSTVAEALDYCLSASIHDEKAIDLPEEPRRSKR